MQAASGKVAALKQGRAKLAEELQAQAPHLLPPNATTPAEGASAAAAAEVATTNTNKPV